MAEIRMITSLRLIERGSWNACFPGELEDYDYLLAIEESGMQGFAWRYLIAEENGVLLAAMPAFMTDYPIDTTLEGSAKKIATKVRTVFPNALTLKLACLGSPDTECGVMGLHPSLTPHERLSLMRAMLEHFEQESQREGANTIGLKDIPGKDEALWGQALYDLGYRAIPGLPIASLPIDFTDMDEYFSRMSSATRKDMRRKLRTKDHIHIEFTASLDEVLPKVMTLYRQVRARAEMQFEELTASFFHNVLRDMPGRAFCALYYAGDELLAANLLLRNETTLLDKFFCMDGERGRAMNLYFISWFTNVAYCLEHGLTNYQSGQASYENKLRLGSKLTRTSMYFKHRNRFIHGALKLAAPLLAADYKEAA